jgi:hypothetical protein
MPKYVLIAGGADLDKRGGNPAFGRVLTERFMSWIDAIEKQGKLIGSIKLADHTGSRLTIRGGEVIDGPFVEAKEAIGGVFLVNAESLDEAETIARSCPTLALQNGYMEVRVVERMRPGVA